MKVWKKGLGRRERRRKRGRERVTESEREREIVSEREREKERERVRGERVNACFEYMYACAIPLATAVRIWIGCSGKGYSWS